MVGEERVRLQPHALEDPQVQHLIKVNITDTVPVAVQPMVFSKKWVRNHTKFLLHFLIHIDVLMLCSKFELIPTSIF